MVRYALKPGELSAVFHHCIRFERNGVSDTRQQNHAKYYLSTTWIKGTKYDCASRACKPIKYRIKKDDNDTV